MEKDDSGNGYGSSDRSFFNTNLARIRNLDQLLDIRWERLQRNGSLSAHAKLVLTLENEIREWALKTNPETTALLTTEEKVIKDKIAAARRQSNLNDFSKSCKQRCLRNII